MRGLPQGVARETLALVTARNLDKMAALRTPAADLGLVMVAPYRRAHCFFLTSRGV